MLETRLIYRVGTRVRLSYRWPKPCPHGGLHLATVERRYTGREWSRAPRGLWAVLDDEWPAACDACGEPAPANHPGNGRSMTTRPIFHTPDGEPHPGDMYWQECVSLREDARCTRWDDCEGEHLIVILPDGVAWCIDDRANNCTMPTDRRHRCWPRAGVAPRITVAKHAGVASCGCGHSIQTPGYHGFLTDGVLRPC